MKNHTGSTCQFLLRAGFVLSVVMLAMVLLPSSAHAQDGCAWCEAEDECGERTPGVEKCNFQGSCQPYGHSGNNCCAHEGESCNGVPVALPLDLMDSDDIRLIDGGSGPVFVAKVETNVFARWDCQGLLVEAYEEQPDGALSLLGAKKTAEIQAKFPLRDVLQSLVAREMATPSDG